MTENKNRSMKVHGRLNFTALLKSSYLAVQAIQPLLHASHGRLLPLASPLRVLSVLFATTLGSGLVSHRDLVSFKLVHE